MNLQLDQFLFILRIVLVALIYLFLIQLIVIVRSDLAKQEKAQAEAKAQQQQMAGDAGIALAGAAPSKGLGFLVVVNPGPMPVSPGDRIGIQPETTIGRRPTNTIMVGDGRISEEHVRIIYRAQQWWVEDLKSTNMTFLNRRQIPPGQGVSARPGDLLTLGPGDGVVSFKFEPARRTEKR